MVSLPRWPLCREHRFPTVGIPTSIAATMPRTMNLENTTPFLERSHFMSDWQSVRARPSSCVGIACHTDGYVRLRSSVASPLHRSSFYFASIPALRSSGRVAECTRTHICTGTRAADQFCIFRLPSFVPEVGFLEDSATLAWPIQSMHAHY